MQISYQSLELLMQYVKDSPNYHQNVVSYKNVIRSAFAGHKEQGIIAELILRNWNRAPLFWAKDYQKILSIVSLNSSFNKTILINPDVNTTIDSKKLPTFVIAQINNSNVVTSKHVRSLRKELGQNYTIHIWEWYWCNLMHTFMNFPQIQQKITFEQDQEEDQLFRMFTKNLFLTILSEGLSITKNDKTLLSRMVSIIEIYLIGECGLKIANRDNKYRLKSHFLCLFFLLIESRNKMSENQKRLHSIQKYQEYILYVFDNYSSITSMNDNHNVTLLIRLWIFYITKNYSPDLVFISSINKANTNTGWYKLQRIPTQNWKNVISANKPSTFDIHKFNNSKKKIFKILSKTIQWTPSMSLFFTIQRYLFLNQLFNPNNIFKKNNVSDQNEQYTIIYRCYQKIMNYISATSHEQLKIQKYQKQIQDLMKNHFQKYNKPFKIQRHDGERHSTLSKSAKQEIKTLNYYCPRSKSPWQYPLQSNQFYLLYEGSLSLAKAIDVVIPGSEKRQYPLLNIRYFANPIIFSIFVIIMIIVARICCK